MSWQKIQVLTVIAMALPAVNAAAIRLIERNGDQAPTERVIAAMYVPSDGVVVIVPDRIFKAAF